MASSTARRLFRGVATPMLAVAAFGLAACTNSQETSDDPGTTPPVFASSPAPAGAESSGAGEHGAEGSASAASGGDAVHATLKDASGKEVGTATFTKSGDHLVVTVEAKGLTPGFHGLHVHQVGKCEGDFASAGGHLQVAGHTGHPSSGDLTSINVLQDGTGTLSTSTDAVTLDDLKADGGRAVIIHAGADNFGNIPNRYTLPDNAPVPDEQTMSTGDAGARVACGVLQG